MLTLLVLGKDSNDLVDKFNAGTSFLLGFSDDIRVPTFVDLH